MSDHPSRPQMYCTSCAALISSNADPCPSCGADPRPWCPRCRARGPLAARFCPACGASLVPDLADAPPSPVQAAESNERKLVTVLFADIVNSTGLAEALDPEQYHAALTALFRQLAAALRAHGAYVEKYVGDSVMAVFGAPKTREDDAARALRASDALHAIAARFADAWSVRLGRRLDLRIGVNSGPVIAGQVGEGRPMDYGVLGETVNLAARLQAEAPPGQTVVGEATRSLVGQSFQFEPLPPRLVPGKSRPVLAFLLRGSRDVEDRSSVELVGRDLEIEVIREAVDAITRGQGVGLAIIGEPGSGKTALLEAAHRQAADLPLTWVYLSCWSHLRDQPLGAVGLLLRERAPVIFRPSRKSDVGRLVSALDTCRAVAARAGLADDPWGPAVVDAVAEFGAGLAAALDRLAPAERDATIADRAAIVLRSLLPPPCVLALDDAQWLDGRSAEVIQAARESETVSTFGCIAALQSSGCFPGRPDVELTLRRLDRPAATGLVSQILGTSAGAGSLAEDLWRGSNGNPRLLMELARSWAGATSVDATASPALQSLFLADLDRLPDEARRVVRVAAVAGAIFQPEAVQALLAGEAVSLSRALPVLLSRGILTPENGEYRFRAPRFAQVARDSLLGVETRRLHRDLAEWLAARTPEDVGPIAHHFLEAGDPRAAEWLRRVGDRRRRQGEVEAAATSYREALTVLERGDRAPSDAIQTAVSLIGALSDLGRVPEAFASLERLAVQVTDEVSRAEVECARATLWLQVGDLDEAETALRSVTSTFSQIPPGSEPRTDRARLVFWTVTAELQVRSGRWEAAISAGEAALARDAAPPSGSASGSTEEDLRVRVHRALAEAWLGKSDSARADQHLTRAAECEQDGASARTLALRAVSAARQGHPDLALDLARHAEQTARDHGDRRANAAARELLGDLHARQVYASPAADLYRAAGEAFDELGDWPSSARCLARARAAAESLA